MFGSNVFRHRLSGLTSVAQQTTHLSRALSLTLFSFSRGVLMCAYPTSALSQTCNYSHVDLYLKHCLTRKICQRAADAFIRALKLNKPLRAML